MEISLNINNKNYNIDLRQMPMIPAEIANLCDLSDFSPKSLKYTPFYERFVAS